MTHYSSGTSSIAIDKFEPETAQFEPKTVQLAPQTAPPHPALIILHGSGGAAHYWTDRVAPTLLAAGVAVYAPHYFDKTGTQRATTEMILDGRHFIAWLTAVQDAVTYVAARPGVDVERIGVLGISLGGYLAVALGIEDCRVRAIVELSGGVPVGWEERMTPAMPPTLILHGDEDQIVPVTEAYKLQQLLDQHRVPHQIEILSKESHWFSGPAQMRLLLRAAGFLTRHL